MNEQRTAVIAHRWYQETVDADHYRRQSAIAVLGEEAGVFAESMVRTEQILASVFDDGPIVDFASKSLFALANNGYALLWSAWLDTLSGRRAAALNHWRSIREIPDYLRAISASPDLGIQFFQGRVKLSTMRRAIRNAMATDNPLAASAWFEGRIQSDKNFQQMSHVTSETAVTTIPFNVATDGAVTYDRYALNPIVTRGVCLYIAAEATLLYAACREVFAGRPAIARLTAMESKDLEQQWVARLETASDEVPIDPWPSVEKS